jgi:plasmid stabilization system protein ParE
MITYDVRYNASFVNDLSDAFQWGVGFWGPEATGKWYNELEQTVSKRLSVLPKGCPLAPEDEDFRFEVRHLIFGRYRVLFTIDQRVVRVLYLRGPHTGARRENP